MLTKMNTLVVLAVAIVLVGASLDASRRSLGPDRPRGHWHAMRQPVRNRFGYYFCNGSSCVQYGYLDCQPCEPQRLWGRYEVYQSERRRRRLYHDEQSELFHMVRSCECNNQCHCGTPASPPWSGHKGKAMTAAPAPFPSVNDSDPRWRFTNGPLHLSRRIITRVAHLPPARRRPQVSGGQGDRPPARVARSGPATNHSCLTAVVQGYRLGAQSCPVMPGARFTGVGCDPP